MNQSSGGASILVVDDAIENLRLLSTILAERGYEVRPVTSGRLALEAAASYPPDAILLDVSMPDMGGLEVCSRLKQMDALRDIPVIFLTALIDMVDKVNGFAVGGADYITKPFQVEEVLVRVEAQVALRRSRAEVQASYERLRALERWRDDMVHMIAHGIRSPLGALAASLDQVRETAAGQLEGNAAECLQSAIQSAEMANRMSSDLLAVSRLEEGELSLELLSVDVGHICRHVIGLLRSTDKSRRLEMTTTQPVAASCDRNLIQRVIENLVGNALQHTGPSGHIALAVSRIGPMVRVEVRDDGQGVSAEVREKIFERHATSGARQEEPRHSTGLGLTFCRMVVDAHGGRIGMEAAVPQGNIFWFELPVQPRP